MIGFASEQLKDEYWTVCFFVLYCIMTKIPRNATPLYATDILIKYDKPAKPIL